MLDLFCFINCVLKEHLGIKKYVDFGKDYFRDDLQLSHTLFTTSIKMSVETLDLPDEVASNTVTPTPTRSMCAQLPFVTKV